MRETFEFAAECQSRGFQRGGCLPMPCACAGLPACLPVCRLACLRLIPALLLKQGDSCVKPRHRSAGWQCTPCLTPLHSILPHPPACPVPCPALCPAPAELLSEVQAREAELGLQADPDLDAFMTAQAFGGRHSLAVEMMLHMLGLEGCADTVVGNQMMRGISGGQKKRVTSGVWVFGRIGRGLASLFRCRSAASSGAAACTTHQAFQFPRSLARPAPLALVLQARRWWVPRGRCTLMRFPPASTPTPPTTSQRRCATTATWPRCVIGWLVSGEGPEGSSGVCEGGSRRRKMSRQTLMG